MTTDNDLMEGDSKYRVMVGIANSTLQMTPSRVQSMGCALAYTSKDNFLDAGIRIIQETRIDPTSDNIPSPTVILLGLIASGLGYISECDSLEHSADKKNNLIHELGKMIGAYRPDHTRPRVAPAYFISGHLDVLLPVMGAAIANVRSIEDETAAQLWPTLRSGIEAVHGVNTRPPDYVFEVKGTNDRTVLFFEDVISRFICASPQFATTVGETMGRQFAQHKAQNFPLADLKKHHKRIILLTANESVRASFKEGLQQGVCDYVRDNPFQRPWAGRVEGINYLNQRALRSQQMQQLLG